MYGSRFYCEPEYYWLTVQTAIDKACFLLYIEHSLDMFKMCIRDSDWTDNLTFARKNFLPALSAAVNRRHIKQIIKSAAGKI